MTVPDREGERRKRAFHHQKLMQGDAGWRCYCPEFLARYQRRQQAARAVTEGRDANAKKFRCEIFISVAAHQLGRNTSWTG